jgi:hypothetical protein
MAGLAALLVLGGAITLHAAGRRRSSPDAGLRGRSSSGS